MRRRWCSAALVAAAGLLGPAQAMDADRALSQYVRDRWGTEKGFPGGTVQAISQTLDGYLWIGTDKGLLRFDGATFRTFPDASRTQPPISQVLGLTADAEGNLWVRLGGAKIIRYHEGRFDPVRSLETAEDAVTAMARGRDGAILVAGIVNGALRWSGDRFQTIAPGAFLPVRSSVISMGETEDGTIWMGTQGEGLFSLSGSRVTPVSTGLPDRKINVILPVSKRGVWVGTDRGIVRWNGTELTSEGVAPALREIAALAMLVDRGSNLWVGTAKGLLRFNARGVSVLDEGDRTRAPVTALFEDREGSLWIGTPRGIERLRDSTFTTYGPPEGLPSETGGPLHVDQEGRAWFAPSTGGLHWLKDGRVASIAAAGLPEDVVYSIAGSRTGLWVGRKRGGLTHLSLQRGVAITRAYQRADGLAEDSVYAVHESRDGTVWAGTLSSGASRLRDGAFTTFTVADGLASNTVTAIVDVADGTTWFATPSGLSGFSKGAWRSLTTRDGLPSDDVACLLEDSGGLLWIGTDEGLALLDSGRVRVPLSLPASLHEQIFGMAEDGHGWLWVATAKRVLRVRLEPLIGGGLSPADVAEYGSSDGLQSTEVVKRNRSVVGDPFGRTWFSMSRGLSVADPVRAARGSTPLLARIEAVSVDGTGLDLAAAPAISPGPRRVTFSYSAVSLSAPDRIRFRYRLDGFDPGWSEPVSVREAVYTNLRPGSYRFRVMASSEGLWGGPEGDVAIAIAPRIWQTGWFQLASATICALILAGLYSLRLHRLTRQLSVRFEERLAERTRIAQDLHDTLLQGFLSASMQLHVAVDQIPAESSARARLDGVLDLMGRVIEEGRNAVRGLRSPEHRLDDLEQAFSRIRHELGIGGKMEFRVIGEGDKRPLNPAIRDDVYRIGREALVNAFRHSGAAHVEAGVQSTRTQLRVLVRDDGTGIDPEVLHTGREGHWGLPGMRERAERIGGHLTVWSRAGGGTEVELTVPGHIAFGSSASPDPLRRLRDRVRGWVARIPRSGDSQGPRIR